MKATEDAKEIVPLLKDEYEDVRWSAAYALGEMKATEYAKEIVPLLKDEDENVRGRAADALGEMKATEYAKEIVPLLKDKDAHVRGWAAIALAELGAKDLVPPEIIPDIKAILEWGDPYAARARAALDALGGGKNP
jgi:HEAT repeat protein